MTPEQRARFAILGWPPPVDRERCATITLKGARCAHRRGPNSAHCQQHARRYALVKPAK